MAENGPKGSDSMQRLVALFLIALLAGVFILGLIQVIKGLYLMFAPENINSHISREDMAHAFENIYNDENVDIFFPSAFIL